MEKIKYYIEKYKLIIIIGVFIILFLIGIILSIINDKESKIEAIELNEVETEEEKEEVVELQKYKVEIKGMVENPGVYELQENSRVIDVINNSGGLKEGANTEYLNLSKKITDEMVIIIYSNDEIEKFREEEKQIIYIEYKCDCPDNINQACINENDTVNTNGVNKDNKIESDDNLISINTATLEELMTLTGIGESKAKSIIEYRETNGGFKNLEELMNVSGIGESAYSKIKDNIKL